MCKENNIVAGYKDYGWASLHSDYSDMNIFSNDKETT